MKMYDKHYITVDAENRITNGFSDAFRQPTEADICINEQGGYQFRLIYVENDALTGNPVRKLSEENPSLYDWDGMIPLYKYENGEVIRRTEEEIEADRAELPVPEPPSPPAESTVWDELAAAYTEGVNSAYEQ